MYRKKKLAGYIPPMPSRQLNTIKKAFKRQGGIIQMDVYTDAYLESKNCEAITYDALTILLHTKPGRAAVFEELIHAWQFRIGKNDGSPQSRLECEIEAQKKLLKNKNAYGLTEVEVMQTEQALKMYQQCLETMIMKGDR